MKNKALTVTQEYPSYYRSKPKTLQRYLNEPASLSIEESEELFKAYISIPNLKSTASYSSALRTEIMREAMTLPYNTNISELSGQI